MLQDEQFIKLGSNHKDEKSSGGSPKIKPICVHNSCKNHSLASWIVVVRTFLHT